MIKTQKISHEGVILKILANQVEVSIESKSACSSCHARGTCGVSSDMKNMTIIGSSKDNSLNVGDRVIVIGKMRDGFLSLTMAYLIPTVLIVITLIAFTLCQFDELYAAIASLIVVMIYYLILFLLRTKIGKNIKFTIEKINK